MAASTLAFFSGAAPSQAESDVENSAALLDNKGADVGWKKVALEYAECAAFHLDRDNKNRAAEFLEKGRLIADSTGVIKAEAVNSHFASLQRHWRIRIEQNEADDMEIMRRNIDCASAMGVNTPFLEKMKQELDNVSETD